MPHLLNSDAGPVSGYPNSPLSQLFQIPSITLTSPSSLSVLLHIESATPCCAVNIGIGLKSKLLNVYG